MKRSPLNKVGKYTKRNLNANVDLRKMYENLGISYCEIGLNNCLGRSFLGFAHRHRRYWYMSKPELLKEYNQTVVSCVNCHQKIDNNKELLESTFERLRGKEV